MDERALSLRVPHTKEVRRELAQNPATISGFFLGSPFEEKGKKVSDKL